MDLFTCRNCIYNPTQGLTFGPGPGFCVQWGSLLERPERTTCKYLHRKDLPHFLVRDAQRERAARPALRRDEVALVVRLGGRVYAGALLRTGGKTRIREALTAERA